MKKHTKFAGRHKHRVSEASLGRLTLSSNVVPKAETTSPSDASAGYHRNCDRMWRMAYRPCKGHSAGFGEEKAGLTLSHPIGAATAL